MNQGTLLEKESDKYVKHISFAPKEIESDIRDILKYVLNDDENTIYLNNNSIEFMYENSNSIDRYSIYVTEQDEVSINIYDNNSNINLIYRIKNIYENILNQAKIINDNRNAKTFIDVYSYFNKKYKLNRVKNIDKIL